MCFTKMDNCIRKKGASKHDDNEEKDPPERRRKYEQRSAKGSEIYEGRIAVQMEDRETATSTI